MLCSPQKHDHSDPNPHLSEIELPYLKDPKGFSLAVSLEPYLFLSASRPSGPVLSPMLSWPQKHENSEPSPHAMIPPEKRHFGPPNPHVMLVLNSLVGA